MPTYTIIAQSFFYNYFIISIAIWIMIINTKNIESKVFLLIEIFYITTSLSILFYPENVLYNGTIKINYLQLMPLKTIKEYIVHKNYSILMGNVLILFPVPIFLFANKIKLKENVFFSFLIATVIEPLQFFIDIITKYPNKIIDIDDYILYLVGISISIIIILIVKKFIKIRDKW